MFSSCCSGGTSSDVLDSLPPPQPLAVASVASPAACAAASAPSSANTSQSQRGVSTTGSAGSFVAGSFVALTSVVLGGCSRCFGVHEFAVRISRCFGGREFAVGMLSVVVVVVVVVHLLWRRRRQRFAEAVDGGCCEKESVETAHESAAAPAVGRRAAACAGGSPSVVACEKVAESSSACAAVGLRAARFSAPLRHAVATLEAVARSPSEAVGKWERWGEKNGVEVWFSTCPVSGVKHSLGVHTIEAPMDVVADAINADANKPVHDKQWLRTTRIEDYDVRLVNGDAASDVYSLERNEYKPVFPTKARDALVAARDGRQFR